jgi:hypothetical protein
MIDWDKSSIYERGRNHTSEVSKLGVPWSRSIFSPKTPRLKASCVRARCHGAGTTTREKTVASHDASIVSGSSKLGDKTSG